MIFCFKLYKIYNTAAHTADCTKTGKNFSRLSSYEILKIPAGFAKIYGINLNNNGGDTNADQYSPR